VRQLVPQQKLPMRSVRVVLPGREVEIASPGKRERPNRRSLRSHMHANIGEVRSQRGLHLGLHIAGQRPSAGSWAKVHLEGIHARAALDRRLLLHRAGIDRGQGEGTGAEEPLHGTVPAARDAWLRNAGRGDRLCDNTIWRRRGHALSVLRKEEPLAFFFNFLPEDSFPQIKLDSISQSERRDVR
jgi:hypothetical protein